mmetsp:Transcript_40398/g.89713  ORF Transcript_40398/g.89713 Transcript_40398/m.89713 type:complete len:215 (-) Transcript_40398:1446-2090(-)
MPRSRPTSCRHWSRHRGSSSSRDRPKGSLSRVSQGRARGKAPVCNQHRGPWCLLPRRVTPLPRCMLASLRSLQWERQLQKTWEVQAGPAPTAGGSASVAGPALHRAGRSQLTKIESVELSSTGSHMACPAPSTCIVHLVVCISVECMVRALAPGMLLGQSPSVKQVLQRGIRRPLCSCLNGWFPGLKLQVVKKFMCLSHKHTSGCLKLDEILAI